MRAYEKVRTPHIVFGSNTLESIGKRLKALNINTCLLVTDPGIVKLGMADRTIKLVEAEGIKCDIYDKCQPDPPDYTCIDVRNLILKNNYDCVIGLGGGSSMDTAKVGALLAGVPGEIEDLHDYGRQGTLLKETYNRPNILVTIPTTSGTGAESTMTGVISSTSLNLKFSCGNENTIADLVIVDPTLTLGMPVMPTVYCGIDILAHSMENAIGVSQSDYSETMMLECIEKAWQWLPIAVKEPNNLEAREQLSWAAHNALCNAGACNGHAVAHAIGSLYHIVHGHACAITMPAVFRHFAKAPEATEAIRKVAGRIGVPVTGDPIADGNHVADAFLNFYKSFGLKTLTQTIKEKGISDTKEQFIEKAVPITLDDFKSHLWTPPIHNSDEAVAKVLEMIWDEE